MEWFANIRSENTRIAYAEDVKQFFHFMGIGDLQAPGMIEKLRAINRPHVIAWRDQLEAELLPSGKRKFGPATIRRKLSALSSLYLTLCEANAVYINPVTGVKRPKEKSVPTQALSDEQVNGIWMRQIQRLKRPLLGSSKGIEIGRLFRCSVITRFGFLK